jgi:hypothetical protein
MEILKNNEDTQEKRLPSKYLIDNQYFAISNLKDKKLEDLKLDII